MDNDIKSTEALKAYARKVLWRHNVTNISLLKIFDEIIDNAPSDCCDCEAKKNER